MPPAVMLENCKINMAQGLPEVQKCRVHAHELVIAGGGPSVRDSLLKPGGYIGAINGSIKWLLEQGIVPNACAVLDSGEHIADLIEPHPDVTFFVAANASPAVFDRLRDNHVVIWFPTAVPGLESHLQVERPTDWFMIGGGCTMGLRWINLGYVCGFRTFHLHGFDSSFVGDKTHAYPDRADVKEHITVDGYNTRLNFLHQVSDFLVTMETFNKSDMDETEFFLYGDGLLQSTVDRYLRECPELFGPRARIRRMPPSCGQDASEIAA